MFVFRNSEIIQTFPLFSIHQHWIIFWAELKPTYANLVVNLSIGHIRGFKSQDAVPLNIYQFEN